MWITIFQSEHPTDADILTQMILLQTLNFRYMNMLPELDEDDMNDIKDFSNTAPILELTAFLIDGVPRIKQENDHLYLLQAMVRNVSTTLLSEAAAAATKGEKRGEYNPRAQAKWDKAWNTEEKRQETLI